MNESFVPLNFNTYVNTTSRKRTRTLQIVLLIYDINDVYLYPFIYSFYIMFVRIPKVSIDAHTAFSSFAASI